MPEQYFLGVDGGQSSTTALLAKGDGVVLGRGVGGPCNHASAEEGRRKFLSAVGDCLEQACRQAGLPSETTTFAGVCFGMSGGAEDKSDYIHQLIRSDEYKLTHDGEIALTGATGGAPGIIIIAGTGSFAFGKNARQQAARSGGWGYIYGDEGGAFDLTRRALRAALRDEEGWGQKTRLRVLLLEATGARTANELLHRFYADVPRSTVATYAPLVTEAAKAGDQVANQILSDAATELSLYVQGVYSQLFPRREPARVSYIGGVFQSELIRTLFGRKIHEQMGLEASAPIYPPVVGALLEAFGTKKVSVPLPLRFENGIAS